MIGRTKLGTKIGLALLIYTVIAMALGSFAGAVDVSSRPIDSDAEPGSASGDAPGELDLGEPLSDVEMPNEGNVPSIDGGITNVQADADDNVGETLPETDLTYEEREQIAEKILGADGAEIDRADTSVASLKSSMDDTVGKIIDNLPSPDSAADATNLYNTVSNYLNGADEEEFGYVPAYLLLAEEGYTADRELVEERTIDSKVFKNDDGTRTAIMNNAPFHYLNENGEWQDIDLNIQIAGDEGYFNVRNSLNTYFNFDTSEIRVDVDGADGLSWTPLEMLYVDTYGLAHGLSPAESSVGTVNGNSIKYENTFQSTTEEYIVMNGGLKHNLILSELPQAAINGMYLSYVGQIELAEGLALYVDGIPVTDTIETTGDIEVRNAEGALVYTLPAPFAFEQANMEVSVDGSYRIEIVDGQIYLSINIPIAWLNDPARCFPIVIDPNVIVEIDLPDNTSNYGWWYQRTYRYSSSKYYTYGIRSSSQYLGGRQSGSYYYLYRDWMRWNTAVIPNTATIKQVDVKFTWWYYTYSRVDIYANLRATNPSYRPDQYYGSQSARRTVWLSLGTGSIYNPQVGSLQPPIKFPGTQYSPQTITVTNLAGTAKSDVKSSLSSNRFYMALHKSSESTYERYYGYFYYWYRYPDRGAWLTVTYDPCPVPPKADAGGTYNWPEGTVNPTLDASTATPDQVRLFILSQYEGNDTTYNMPIIRVIEGKIDLERFEETLRRLIDRHEVLRTSFDVIDEKVVQRIHLEEEIDFNMEYLEYEAGPGQESELEPVIDAFLRPFDLKIPPLIRLKLVRLSRHRHLFILDKHHIISDGIS
ncbi:MAG: hypothetical protein JSV49_10520 [Thermoplasmata archaeon]|nr:MAG: hypothetical protein JSV49_10520 [Thermoplasmata archaeon]